MKPHSFLRLVGALVALASLLSCDAITGLLLPLKGTWDFSGNASGGAGQYTITGSMSMDHASGSMTDIFGGLWEGYVNGTAPSDKNSYLLVEGTIDGSTIHLKFSPYDNAFIQYTVRMNGDVDGTTCAGDMSVEDNAANTSTGTFTMTRINSDVI